jgi:Cu(I)/Ag(I) efflux system membrane protein CusA/SilA
MIKSEMGSLTGWTYVDIDTDDVGGYVQVAKAKVEREVKLPPGYFLKWTGQYELLERVRARMAWILPLTVGIVFLILYMNFKGAAQALIVMTSVPFAAVGAIWMLWFAHFNTSIAVWVGMIALMGLDAETGVFMLLFLDLAYYEAVRAGRMRTLQDLRDAIIHGAVKRIRPKMMTVTAAFAGLMPIMWSLGTGADMMKRVVAPMIGGLFTSFILELLVYPPIYQIWKWNFEMKRGSVEPSRIPIPESRG